MIQQQRRQQIVVTVSVGCFQHSVLKLFFLKTPIILTSDHSFPFLHIIYINIYRTFTYINYFQRCWIESLALLHNFAVNGFVNLIPYDWEAHNVVLDFYGEKPLNSVSSDHKLKKKTRNSQSLNKISMTYSAWCLSLCGEGSSC